MLALAAAIAIAAEPATVATIDPRHRLIEGVASDGRTIWVSSVIDRQIVECRKRCRTIATLPEGLHPFAISWDQSGKRLWVAADCPPNISFIKACERGELIALDVRGRIRTRVAPLHAAFHPGDISASNGLIFASDSQNGAIYQLRSIDGALLTLVPPGVGKSAQGSAVDSSGKKLVVSDYSQGIASVELGSGVRTLAERVEGRPMLRGIDGLARCGDTYYGAYNGASPGRIIAFRLVGHGVDYADLVEGLTLPDPTQIAFDGRRLLIVADSGWEQALEGKARTSGAPIVAIRLDRGCRPY